MSDGFAVFAYVRAVLCAKTSDSSVETAKACCFAVLPAAFAVFAYAGAIWHVGSSNLFAITSKIICICCFVGWF